MDADDWVEHNRIAKQVQILKGQPRAIVGSRFRREPEGSTERYTRWANGLSELELVTNRFKECTVLQPTWMLRRAEFDAIGGYNEARLCEDLDFFYRHFESFVAQSPFSSAVQFDRRCVQHWRAQETKQKQDAAVPEQQPSQPADRLSPSLKRSKCGPEREADAPLPGIFQQPYTLLRDVTTVYTYRCGFFFFASQQRALARARYHYFQPLSNCSLTHTLTFTRTHTHSHTLSHPLIHSSHSHTTPSLTHTHTLLHSLTHTCQPCPAPSTRCL